MRTQRLCFGLPTQMVPVWSCGLLPSSSNAADVALTRPGGFLYAHIVFAKDGSFTGTVTGGSGRYAGASGTATGVVGSANHEIVTIKYHN